MEVGYKKDLKHNYMIIEGDSSRMAEPFCLKMLEHQDIEGILPLEQKLIDNRILLYYEITARQSIINIYDKTVLSFDNVKALCAGIIQTIERTYEFLLPEDDFILTPEFIYIDISTNAPSLCYYPGYGKCIKDQMNGFLEFIMNKVDYQDKEAVYLVYQLYAVSKEEGYTFDYLKEVLLSTGTNKQSIESRQQNKNLFKNSDRNSEKNLNKNSNKDSSKNSDRHSDYNLNKNKIPKINCDIHKEDEIQINDDQSEAISNSYEKKKNILSRKTVFDYKSESKIPIVMEKVEGETEVSCYSLKTYFYAGACVLGGIMAIVFCIAAKIIYNTFGNSIDYSKLFALLLITLCIEGYLLSKILDKKNKITKMIKTHEYIDPREDYQPQATQTDRKTKGSDIEDAIQPIYKNQNKGRQKNIFDDREDIDNENRDKELRYNENNYKEDRFKENNFKEIKDANEVIEPTRLLNAAIEKTLLTPILKAQDEANYSSIPITSFPFFIGKLKKNVDYCLENDMVSRYHAKITKEDDDTYFLMDLNSTNGTFINQELLQTYQRLEIKVRDEIAFANIKYWFMQE